MRNLVILGGFALGMLSGKAHADLVILDVPGATYYAPTGVSGNEVVGFYANSPQTNGFLYSGGPFSTIAPPGAASVNPGGISVNTIVGSYTSLTSSGQVHAAAIINSGEQGFLYDGKTYTTLSVPGASSTNLSGISGNTVVGYDSVSGVQHGIVYQGGKFTTIDVPGASGTTLAGVSSNKFAGTYYDLAGQHGFVYDGKTFTTLNVPGGTGIDVTGISGNRVVGTYTDNTGFLRSFVYDGYGFAPFNLPGAQWTNVLGINGDEIIGLYENNNGETHAFLDTSAFSSAPEPSSLSLLVIGTLGMAGARWRPKR
jgi:hypothetical protein